MDPTQPTFPGRSYRGMTSLDSQGEENHGKMP